MVRLSFAGGTLCLAVVVAHMDLAVHGQAANAGPPSPSSAGSGSSTAKITLSRPSNIPTSFSPTPYGIRYINFGDYEFDPEVVGAHSRFDMDTLKDNALGVTHIEEFDKAGNPLKPPNPQYFLVYDLTNVNIRVDGRYCQAPEKPHCVCYSAKMKDVATDVKKKASELCGEGDMSYICWSTQNAVYVSKDGEVTVDSPASANAIVLHFETTGAEKITKLVWWTDKNDQEDKDGKTTKTCSVITNTLTRLRLVETYLYGRKGAVNSIMLKFPGCSTIEHNGCYFGNQLVETADRGNVKQQVYEDLVDVEVHPPQRDFEEGSDAYEQAHQCNAEAENCCKLEEGSDTGSGSGSGAVAVMMALVAAATLLPLL